jgi:hypothetical protein
VFHSQGNGKAVDKGENTVSLHTVVQQVQERQAAYQLSVAQLLGPTAAATNGVGACAGPAKGADASASATLDDQQISVTAPQSASAGGLLDGAMEGTMEHTHPEPEAGEELPNKRRKSETSWG